MKTLFQRTVMVAAATLAMWTAAQAAQCPDNFAGGLAPQVTNSAMQPKTRELCFRDFAVLHSGITRTPLWSAEHLTEERVRQAKQVARVNAFHPEASLPTNERAELHDYLRSGFDRGHLSPSGDRFDSAAQYDSFTLANMVPQDPDNNRHLWEGIESAVRTLAMRRGDIYVVTGPLFEGSSLQRLKGRVMVPTHMFKVIYDPHTHQAGAYLTRNAAGNDYAVVSVAEIERRSGINILPGVDARVKDNAMALPKPTPHGGGGGSGEEFPHMSQSHRHSAAAMYGGTALVSMLRSFRR